MSNSRQSTLCWEDVTRLGESHNRRSSSNKGEEMTLKEEFILLNKKSDEEFIILDEQIWDWIEDKLNLMESFGVQKGLEEGKVLYTNKAIDDAIKVVRKSPYSDRLTYEVERYRDVLVEKLIRLKEKE